MSNLACKTLSPPSTASVFICLPCQGLRQNLWVIKGNPFLVHYLHAGSSCPTANNNRESLHLRDSGGCLLGFLMSKGLWRDYLFQLCAVDSQGMKSSGINFNQLCCRQRNTPFYLWMRNAFPFFTSPTQIVQTRVSQIITVLGRPYKKRQ